MNIEQQRREQDSQEFELSRQAIISICDEIFALKSPDDTTTFQRVVSKLDPKIVHDLLTNSAINDLWLKEGESLSDKNCDIGLVIGNTKPTAVALTATGIEVGLKSHKLSEINPNNDSSGLDDTAEEIRKQYELEIHVWYYDKETKQEACQTISLHTASRGAFSTTPLLCRDVSAMAYAETGYEGHNAISRPAKNNKEVLELVSLAQELFNNQR